MRIISGIAKGRKLFAPKGPKTRPTSDRVKEAIFNLINDCVTQADVLDLFAGAGTLGLEALSRGGKAVTFVETQGQALKALTKNLNSTGFTKQAKVIKKDAFILLGALNKRAQRFDLIFADPPYKIETDLLTFLVEQALGLLKPGALLIIEHSKRKSLDEFKANIYKSKTYGDTIITLLKKEK